MPKRSDWTYAEEPVAEPKEGELLVKVLYISLDPAMRGWMNEARSYSPPVGIGELMRALGVGIVTESRNPRFAVGDYVSGAFGMHEYARTDGRGVTKIDTKIAPLPAYLSVLGMTGMTAYFGLLETGQPKAGDMVVVSAAAGAVGAVVGQIAKIKDCRWSASREEWRSAATSCRSWASTPPLTTSPRMLRSRCGRIARRALTFILTTWAAQFWTRRWRT